MQALGGSPTEFAEGISFQDVQHLAQGRAARAGRRRRDHMIAAVVALNGGKLTGPVVLEIGLIDDPAVALARPYNGRRRLAPVETINASLADQTQRSREVALH